MVRPVIRRRFMALGALFVAACAAEPPVGPAVLGDFRLGYVIVQANDVTEGPFSRAADRDDLTAALTRAVEARLGRYDGDGLYHVGIAIGAYVLAQPGVPLVYTPRSALIFEVNIYDNATRRRLNETPHRITAFEGLRNVAPVVGSGLARGKEEQLANLSREGARLLDRWLSDHPDWFAPGRGRARVEIGRDDLRRMAREAVAAAK